MIDCVSPNRLMWATQWLFIKPFVYNADNKFRIRAIPGGPIKTEQSTF